MTTDTDIEWCDKCGEPAEDGGHYIVIEPATWDCPADGVVLCDACNDDEQASLEP